MVSPSVTWLQISLANREFKGHLPDVCRYIKISKYSLLRESYREDEEEDEEDEEEEEEEEEEGRGGVRER